MKVRMGGSTYGGRLPAAYEAAGPPAVVSVDVPRSSFREAQRTPRTNTLMHHSCGRPDAERLPTGHRRHHPIGQYKLHWLELIGVLIGLASAWLGMRRRVWRGRSASSANIMLFFVYSAPSSGPTERIPLFGQAGRQVFFIITSIYGWWRWSQVRRLNHAGDASGVAITPRWATAASGWPRRLLARRHRRRPPGLRVAVEPLAEPVLHPAVVVLLVRRVDLRRLHRRHVCHGSRLERVLARLDRRRPGRRAASASRPTTCRPPCSTPSTASSSSTASPSGSRSPAPVPRRAYGSRCGGRRLRVGRGGVSSAGSPGQEWEPPRGVPTGAVPVDALHAHLRGPFEVVRHLFRRAEQGSRARPGTPR